MCVRLFIENAKKSKISFQFKMFSIVGKPALQAFIWYMGLGIYGKTDALYCF